MPSTVPHLTRRSWAEPYKIKVVEPVRMTTREHRERAIAEAGYNTFLLRSEDVYIDLLTDSGTNAMSDRQWAGMMIGDEAYAGSRSFYRLEETIRRIYGYNHAIPTHQGRGAEHIISKILIQPGDIIPGNMYFTTTRVHQELAGGRFVDVIIPEAHEPSSEHPFKGNIDLRKLEDVLRANPGRVPYVSVAATVNMAGGQPISLENLRAVRDLTRRYDVLMILDATRVAENAYFNQQRECSWPIARIVREICSLTDGCTMSAKKDPLVNIGGFLALNDEGIAEKARNMVVIYEGLHTYGGMSGRDMEAVAIGIEESVEDEHIHARVGQVLYLGEKLHGWGIPIVLPIGGHGVFLDARAFLPHVPQELCPAQSLAAAIYTDSGVRTMERGIVSAGRDPETGQEHKPRLELVRLAIPRRVYTQAHMDVTAESILSVYEDRDRIGGLKIVYEPKFLRFFQARFTPVPCANEEVASQPAFSGNAVTRP
ncbi:MAG TPA: tryptophanase [Bryobacteraceae bacterium]|nr:tryptophanase [Bryobacteraceae bacterium]